ncbi:hypothetical protein ACLKA7_001486 [Drosophila subpalustris]
MAAEYARPQNPSPAPAGRPRIPFRARESPYYQPQGTRPIKWLLRAVGHRCAQEEHFAGECPNAWVEFCRQRGKRGRGIQNCCGARSAENDPWRSLGQGKGDANAPTTRQLGVPSSWKAVESSPP